MTIIQGEDVDVTPPPRIEIKGSRARWNLVDAVGERGGYRIYDAATRRLFTVSPAQRSVMAAHVPEPAPDASSRWTFQTMAYGKVADVPCERWRTTDENGTYDLCVARGFFPVPLHLVVTNATLVAPFLSELEGRGLFVLAVQARWGGDAGGPLGGTLRAVEIERRVVEATRMQVPPFPVTEASTTTPLMPAPR